MGQAIVILGGGTGGVVAANVLRQLVPPAHTITVIDRRENHQFQASFPLVLIGHRRAEDVVRPLSALREKGIEFVQAEITGVDLQTRQVHTNVGTLAYDYLIISLGAERHPQSVPGFKEAVFDAHSLRHLQQLAAELPRFHRGRIVLFISHLPFSGTVGPYEMVLLLSDFFHRQKRRHVQLTLVTPEPYLLSAAGPRLGPRFQDLCLQQGIRVVTQARVLYLDHRTGHLVLDGGIYIPGDMFIGVPSHRGPTILRKTILSQDGGWLKAHPYTLATAVPKVFAIGDAVGIRLPVTGAWLPKAGVFAHYQAEMVARNIALELAGKPPRFRFTGKAVGASLITSLGRAMPLSIRAYQPTGPRLSLLPPLRLGYAAKVAFEQYWLNRWF